jgi:methyltransferase (TIGR00027 family)
MTRSTLVTHISDTARWVAIYRAQESARPDALFRDPYAERLAGERGREIFAGLHKPMRRNAWPMVMRTKAIDDLVLEGIAAGADRVVNLAAGLDARPYRLALPAGLTWIEADLPGILDEKERILEREKPRCLLTRERVDLSDPAARRAFLDRAVEGASNVIVIAEGLLLYLDDDAVRTLGRDLAERRAIRSWVVDLLSPRILRALQKRMAGLLSDDAKMRFAPANGVAFFEPLGWKAAKVRTQFEDAARTNRLPWLLRPLTLLPRADPANPGEKPWSAVVQFERVTPAAG